MNWREKANYLAKRAQEKGGIWLIWLNREPRDDPSQLGSTTDEDDLRDPNHAELGHYDGAATKERILADVAKAIGDHPGGEASEPKPGNVQADGFESAGYEPEPEAGAAPDPIPASPGGGPEPSPEEPAQDFPYKTTIQLDPEHAQRRYSEAAYRHAKAVLYRQWLSVHDAGQGERRELYEYLIERLEEVAGG